MGKQVDLEEAIDAQVMWETLSPPERKKFIREPKSFEWGWDYERKPVIKDSSQLPKDAVGFVYIIENTKTDECYIGKKILKHKRTLPPLKGKKRKRVKHVDSDWLTYMGSSDITKTWNPVDCTREILCFCSRKDEMTYYETKAIFNFGFEHPNLINSNILGKFYKKTVEEKFGKIVY